MHNKLLKCKLIRVTINIGSCIKAVHNIMIKAHVLRQRFTSNTRDTNARITWDLRLTHFKIKRFFDRTIKENSIFLY